MKKENSWLHKGRWIKNGLLEAGKMPGGGAKSKESSLDAIKREVKEETGLDVINGRVVYSYFNEDETRHDNYFVDIYHFKI